MKTKAILIIVIVIVVVAAAWFYYLLKPAEFPAPAEEDLVLEGNSPELPTGLLFEADDNLDAALGDLQMLDEAGIE